MNDGNATITQQARLGQILTFALVQGMIVIAAVMAFITFSQPEPEPPVEPVGVGAYVLPAIVVFMIIMAFAANMIIVPMIRRVAIQRFHGDADAPNELPGNEEPVGAPLARLIGADQAARVVGQACFEGGGTIAAVFMMMDRNPSYLIAVAVALAGIAAQFPSVTKIRHWLENVIQDRRA